MANEGRKPGGDSPSNEERASVGRPGYSAVSEIRG
jgi:hypothetical protein